MYPIVTLYVHFLPFIHTFNTRCEELGHHNALIRGLHAFLSMNRFPKITFKTAPLALFVSKAWEPEQALVSLHADGIGGNIALFLVPDSDAALLLPSAGLLDDWANLAEKQPLEGVLLLSHCTLKTFSNFQT